MPRCILRAPMAMQPPERSDAELIQACRRGEEAAWEALVRKYRRLVYSIPHRGGLTAEEGSDVFQTVFLALMRSLETLHQEQTLIPWLMTTAKRETWKVRRKRAREVPEDDAHPEPSSPEDSPEVPLEQLERQVAVRAAIQGECSKSGANVSVNWCRSSALTSSTFSIALSD